MRRSVISLVNPILTILKPEESLLLLYLATEFFLRGHIGEVLGSIELIVCAEGRVVGHVIVGVGTKQDAYCGVVTFRTLVRWTCT